MSGKLETDFMGTWGIKIIQRFFSFTWKDFLWIDVVSVKIANYDGIFPSVLEDFYGIHKFWKSCVLFGILGTGLVRDI